MVIVGAIYERYIAYKAINDDGYYHLMYKSKIGEAKRLKCGKKPDDSTRIDMYRITAELICKNCLPEILRK